MNPTDPNPDYRPTRYEWDYWEEDALERGLDLELATLGRAVLREAVNHNWSPMLREVCSEMTLDEILFKAPDLGKRLFTVLLETDGLRVAFAEGDPTTSDMIELRDF